MNKWLLRFLAGYVRNSPFEKGKWRLAITALALTKKYGQEIGWTTVTTRHGFKMKLNLSDWVDKHIFATGLYEPEVVNVVLNALKPGDIAVDIGANIGFFSLLFAKLVGSDGKVLSFEPQPKVVARLKENISFHANSSVIEVNEFALGANSGTVNFNCGPEDHSGVGSLRELRGSPEHIQVKVCRGDDVFDRNMPIRLMKIDVEGAEYLVLEGIRETLKTWHPDLIMEISDSYLKQLGSSANQLTREFQSYGYRMWKLGEHGNLEVKSWSESLPNQFNAFLSVREFTASA
jgi:FkbM family methyltransferase